MKNPVPRQVNDKPTFIYWLIDMRPEVVASGHANGYPFYCGKTVKRPIARLWSHFGAARLNPTRPVCERLNQCTEQFVRIQIMETVPASDDWTQREKHWIKVLRFSFPENVNTADGGSGAPGLILGAARRAQISATQKGKITPIPTRAKMSAVQKGRIFTDDHKAKLKETWKTRRQRPCEWTGLKRTPQQRENIGASKRGKPWTQAQKDARKRYLENNR